jgi:hypothetical protein
LRSRGALANQKRRRRRRRQARRGVPRYNAGDLKRGGQPADMEMSCRVLRLASMAFRRVCPLAPVRLRNL